MILKYRNKKIRKLFLKNGFTLVEVLMTIFVFSIIVIGISSIFIQVLRVEKRGFAAQKIQENGLFVMEMMARDIRVSALQGLDDTSCNTTTLTMNHPIKGTITYRLTNNIVEKSEGSLPYQAISGSVVKFSKLNFCIKGSGSNDNQTPRVAILASIQNATDQILKFDLQTTVSSRDVSSEFQHP